MWGSPIFLQDFFKIRAMELGQYLMGNKVNKGKRKSGHSNQPGRPKDSMNCLEVPQWQVWTKSAVFYSNTIM